MQSAKEKTTITKFKEDVNFAYMELYSEGAEKGNYSEITVDKIIPRLKQNYGYTDENLHTQILGTVELKVLEEGNIEMATGSSKEVRVVTSDDNKKNYVKLDGMWYEFSITGDQVTVGEGKKEIPGESENVNSSQLQAISNNEDVTVSASTGTFIVTIKSNENPTLQNQPAVITVSYGGSSIKINVTVKQAYTLTVGSNNAEYGTVSVSPTSTNNKYIEETQVTVTANANEGYVFKGWYTGTDTTDDMKLIANAESSYTIILNSDTTLTAKFGDLDNSNSYAEGFVDYLGTRATIYLYANAKKITSGTITVTMPDANSTTSIITATGNNTEIGSNVGTRKYYDTYTVAKDGIYSFQVKNNSNNQTSTTVIKVEGIEKFTSIESLAQSQNLTSEDSGTKSYNYNGAAVPKGYYVDTNSTIENGLVITDDIDSEGYSTGNEWVWVPVETNPTGTDRKFYVVASGNVNGADANTEESPNPITYSKYAKLYSFSQARTRNDYGTFYPYGSSTQNYYGLNKLGTPAGTSGYREPSLLTSTIYGDEANITAIAKRNGIGNFDTGDIKNVASQYVTDYNNMVTSIEKYGGFYIGRYELANVSGTAKVQPGISYTDETWFSLYNKCLIFGKKVAQSGGSVQITESSMMYGSLWDAVMYWLSSSYDVGYTVNACSGYGNFYAEAITVSNSDNSTVIVVKKSSVKQKLATGQTSHTRSNNIYDLSGNCLDWTQEAYSDNSRVSRGGFYDRHDDLYSFSASRYTNYLTPSAPYQSTRPQLYIKIN